MDASQIEERLATLGGEIATAQAEVDKLVDADGTKPQAFILAEGRLRLLKSEKARLTAALPEARQRDLDLAEDAADAAAKAARKRFTERKGEIVQWLSENGWSGASDYDRAKIADMHDDVVALRGELMKADQAATKTAHAAAVWWSERKPGQRRERVA
jgi:hypothetical protein